MRGGVVRAGVATTFRDQLARYRGVSPDRLIQEAGIDPDQLGDPDGLLDQARWVALLEAAADATGDPCIGLELAIGLPWKDLGVLGYVVLHSPTAGAALANSARYLAVQQTGGRLALDVGARTARYAYTMADPRITAYGQHAESLFALAVRLVRERTGDPAWAPRELELRHAAPADPARHARFFRCPVRFGRPTYAMIVAAADLAAPFTTADAGLLPVLLRHAEECLARAPAAGDLVADVRRAVIAAISAGDPAIEDVASRLGTSGRSLQRRLAAGGRSYKAVVDETRLGLARRYLADPTLSLTETAFLLGYSDLSAFSRAFRRWTGTTALAFRRRATAKSAAG